MIGSDGEKKVTTYILKVFTSNEQNLGFHSLAALVIKMQFQKFPKIYWNNFNVLASKFLHIAHS